MKKKSLNVKKKIHNSIIKNLKNKDILKIFDEFKKSLNKSEKYAVALSGGPDSIALAFLSKCFSLVNNTKIYYFIVNHKLRKESLVEAKKVSSTLKNFQINCKILNWNGKKPSSNLQSIARNNRYALLINECNKKKIKYLLLGHHVDDLYENFLIRLLRGSGLKGLVSMDKVSKSHLHNVQILRPLINISKVDLINLTKKVFNFYIQDPSNLDKNFKRVRIRNLIHNLESEGLDKKKLKLTIDNLKNSEETINFYVEDNIKKNSIYSKNMYILKKKFFEQPNEIIFRSLSDLTRMISKKYYPSRGKSINKKILEINDKNFRKTTLGGCIIEKSNETILIFKENSIKR